MASLKKVGPPLPRPDLRMTMVLMRPSGHSGPLDTEPTWYQMDFGTSAGGIFRALSIRGYPVDAEHTGARAVDRRHEQPQNPLGWASVLLNGLAYPFAA